MLGGFNTNVRHRNVLFHVQTEDSGRAHPRLITHLYHRGTILASERCDYSEHLEKSEDELATVVKSLVEAQHKSMVRQLCDGAFDDVIAERLGAAIFGDTTERKSTSAPVPAEGEGTGRTEPLSPPAASFGDGIDSEQPLDEVVLSFLVENARRKRSAK